MMTVVSVRKIMFVATMCSGWAVGCARIPTDAGFPEVQGAVGERLHQQVQWRRGTAADAEVERVVREMLGKQIGPDEAVQIALLNNPSLQATYEELGISQADVVEAGLLENPVFFAEARSPTRGPGGTHIELEVVQDFLNVLMRPARKKLAQTQFDAVKLRVGDEVIAFASEVEKAYHEYVGASHAKRIHELVAEAAETGYEMAKRFHDAGNISDLDLAREQNMHEDARVELARSEMGASSAREKLTRLMGLRGDEARWTAPETLPGIPVEETSEEDLEARAVAERLDLAAAQQDVAAVTKALETTRKWRWLGLFEVGARGERELEGVWLVGPVLSLELPIFHQRQARIARLEAQLRQSERRSEALEVDIRSEVRELRDRLMLTRDLIEHYRTTVIPLREQIVALTEEEYNYMLIGVFELLAAKREEFDAYDQYVEVLRDYWKTRAELRRAVGGRLPKIEEDEAVVPQLGERTETMPMEQPSSQPASQPASPSQNEIQSPEHGGHHRQP